jgi:hypothetical protein
MDRSQSGLDVGGFGSNPKHVVLVFGSVLAAALAVAVGRQMSNEAMAVVVGIVCGVVASIPTTLLLLVALTRRNPQGFAGGQQQTGQREQPPVVVIQGRDAAPGLHAGPPAGYWPAAMPGRTADRLWHVVGGDDLLLENGRT